MIQLKPYLNPSAFILRPKRQSNHYQKQMNYYTNVCGSMHRNELQNVNN